jgi:DNA repair protein RecO (recombination protein O)
VSFSSKAIVLSKESFGEADSYIQFFTQRWGMISVLARSAKKSLRRYVGGLDLFCHDEIFIRGDPKDRPYLNELRVLNSFTGIRESLDRVMMAGKVTQWVKKLANAATPQPSVYSLLGQTLALIEKESDERRLELLGLIFRLKLLSQLGLKPHVESCARCADPLTEESLFDLESGGILCSKCSLTSPLHQFLKLGNPEREFLHHADNFRLSQWSEIHFPRAEAQQLIRLVTQFASYHTHMKLPA